MKTLSIQIPEDLYAELEQISEHDRRSKGFIVRDSIKHYLNWLQDRKDVKNAEQALKDIKSGKDTTVSAEEVFRRNGL